MATTSNGDRGQEAGANGLWRTRWGDTVHPTVRVCGEELAFPFRLVNSYLHPSLEAAVVNVATMIMFRQINHLQLKIRYHMFVGGGFGLYAFHCGPSPKFFSSEISKVFLKIDSIGTSGRTCWSTPLDNTCVNWMHTQSLAPLKKDTRVCSLNLKDLKLGDGENVAKSAVPVSPWPLDCKKILKSQHTVVKEKKVKNKKNKKFFRASTSQDAATTKSTETLHSSNASNKTSNSDPSQISEGNASSSKNSNKISKKVNKKMNPSNEVISSVKCVQTTEKNVVQKDKPVDGEVSNMKTGKSLFAGKKKQATKKITMKEPISASAASDLLLGKSISIPKKNKSFSRTKKKHPVKKKTEPVSAIIESELFSQKCTEQNHLSKVNKTDLNEEASKNVEKNKTKLKKGKKNSISKKAENINSSLTEAAAERKPGNKVNNTSQTDFLQSLIIDMKSVQLYPPIGKSVLVVESATKAKIIQGYLGDMYEVVPSYGHLRNLAPRSGSVRPDADFDMVWEVSSSAWTHLKTIKAAMSRAENLILASDPDREGEAIAWHIVEMLNQQDAFERDVKVTRVVFQEITESSIKNALQSPRTIDQNLVNAYLSRIALDYLIGFGISPLLWRKLPGCTSAGRVQSAALSLLCDREIGIDKFSPQEYWTIDAEFKKEDYDITSVTSSLTHMGSKKLSQNFFTSQVEVENVEKVINSTKFSVVKLKKTRVQRNPPGPYITSSLQQDAANQFHFSTLYTMMIAQKLYEGIELSDGKATGLITYLRTDGLHVSEEAAKDIHSLVLERYGSKFALPSIRTNFKHVKNSQEAHECIRPTDIRRVPSSLSEILDEDSLKLYTLIWSRTLACQMSPANDDKVQVEIGGVDCDSQSIIFRSVCSRLDFLGFKAVYRDVEAKLLGSGEKEETCDNFDIISLLKVGDSLNLKEIVTKQHFTQHPPRYSEASLIKKLEELGIGRPSTYASILKVLQDRNYVTVKNRVIHPEFRGRMLSEFLSQYFSEVVDYGFTSQMENQLDSVCAGLVEWRTTLKDYWSRFVLCRDRASIITIHQVEKMLEKKFSDSLFSSLPNKIRTCPSCGEGTLSFKISKYGQGYFIACNRHPSCKYICKTLYTMEGDDDDTSHLETDAGEPKILGTSPDSNEKVFLKYGPYGSYVQLGEDNKGHSSRRASTSKIKDVDSITLELALELLRYPITLGKHPTDNFPVLLRLSNSGFSIRHRNTIFSLPKKMNPNEVTLEKALTFLRSKKTTRTGRPKTKKKQLVD